jgi:adhesin transport system outer membrane protein
MLAHWRIGRLADLLRMPATLDLERPDMLLGAKAVPGVMTLSQALDLGATANPEAQIAIAQERAQRETSAAAWRQLGPKVDVRVAGGRGQFDGVSGPTPTMPRGDRSVTLRQPVFDWSAWQEALRQQSNAKAAAFTRFSAQSSSALEAANIYLSVLQSGLIVGFTNELEELLSELLRYMEGRTAAGGASPADLERVRARVANARASVSENRAGLVTNLAEFARLTGRVPLSVAVPEPPAIDLPLGAAMAIGTARQENFDLQAARRLANSAFREVKGAEGRFMPRVDLEASATQNRNPSGLTGVQADERVLMIMSWNIFNSGADLAQRRASLARWSEFKIRVDNSERRIRQQLENAYSVLDSIDARFTAVAEEVEANRKVVAAFREQLNSTNRQLLDVLDAYQRFYQSKVDVTNLLVTEAQVSLQVAHLLGRLRRPDTVD